MELTKKARLLAGLVFIIPGLIGLIYSLSKLISSLVDLYSIVIACCFIIIGIIFLGVKEGNPMLTFRRFKLFVIVFTSFGVIIFFIFLFFSQRSLVLMTLIFSWLEVFYIYWNYRYQNEREKE